MLDCKLFWGKGKQVEKEVSEFLKTFPPDFDLRQNMKVIGEVNGSGPGWTGLAIIFKT